MCGSRNRSVLSDVSAFPSYPARPFQPLCSTHAGQLAILDHYKAIYGERILAVPDGVTGQLAFAIPMVVFAGSCAFMALVLRRFRIAARLSAAQTPTDMVSAERMAILQGVRTELETECRW
jgi:hypothetical protein